MFHLSLPDFDEADFIKLLRCDERVEQRMERGELPVHEVKALFGALGGTPGLVKEASSVLRTSDIEELINKLKEGEPGRLGETREAYLQKILADALFEALSAESRAVVCRVAVSDLPIPLDAVAWITGREPEAIATSLGECVSMGLLQRLDQENLPGLYQAPGLLRPWLLAFERISQDGAIIVHRLLAAFWRSRYEAGRERELRVPIDAGLLACRTHAEQGHDATNFCWATDSLATLLVRRSETRRARALIEQVPASDRTFRLWVTLGGLKSQTGETEQARSDLEQALALNPPVEGTAWVLDFLARIDVSLGRYDVARARFRESLRIARVAGDREGEARLLGGIASIDLEQGNYRDAREGFDQSLRIMRTIGDMAGEAASLHSLATVDLRQHRFDDARYRLEESLQITRTVGDRVREASTLHQFAIVDVHQGRLDDAHDRLCDSVRIASAIGDRRGEATSLHALASIDMERRKYKDARDRFIQSWRILRDTGDKVGEAQSLHQLSVLAWEVGRRLEAVAIASMSWQILQSVEHGDRTSELLYQVALFNKLGYDKEQAKAALEEGIGEYARDGGESLLDRTFAGLTSGDWSEARVGAADDERSLAPTSPLTSSEPSQPPPREGEPRRWFRAIWPWGRERTPGSP